MTPSPLLIRPFAREDTDACLDVWRRASQVGHPFLSSADLDEDADLVRDNYLPAARVSVAERAGAVVGFVALYEGMIGGLFVNPDHHRAGIGARLIATLGTSALVVEVYAQNTRARAFYAAQGFVETLCHVADDRGRPHPLVRMTRPAREKTGPAPRASGLRAAA